MSTWDILLPLPDSISTARMSASAAGGECKRRTLNFNVGVVGHVDSGKTTLCRALSTLASTAAFDKNPQSRERGITLDLGFSSFTVPAPDHVRQRVEVGYDDMQVTLVDCPGHASLIRTIIGGAQIIDLMLLVIDINKGIQTQTAECLVIGQITTKHMIIALNKVDTVAEDKRQHTVDKMCKRLRKSLSDGPFADAPIIPVSASEAAAAIATNGNTSSEGAQSVSGGGGGGVSDLVVALRRLSYAPARHLEPPFLMAVDHCFSIRGQGTVLTGTVLHGHIAINNPLEIPSIKLTRKVKSIQMFKQPVKSAAQGDRCGICVSQFDPSLLERGLVCTPDAVPTVYAVIMPVHKIAYYKTPCHTNTKLHISIGHETVMGKVTFFASRDTLSGDDRAAFSTDEEYVFREELLPDADCSSSGDCPAPAAGGRQFALVELGPGGVPCPRDSLVIASKLDADIHSHTCRLAFHGRVAVPLTDRYYARSFLPLVRIGKEKRKEGVVERMASDDCTVIGKGMFKKETNIQNFTGMKVTLSTGEKGVIDGPFGQSGKFKVRIYGGLLPSTVTTLAAKEKKGKRGKQQPPPQPQASESAQDKPAVGEPIKIHLQFKRYIYDSNKKMVQM